MYAAIDAGSNTLRLLVGRIVGSNVVPSFYLRRICRLAGGFSAEEGLAPCSAVGDGASGATDRGSTRRRLGA